MFKMASIEMKIYFVEITRQKYTYSIHRKLTMTPPPN